MDYNKSIVCEEVAKHADELCKLSNKIWKYAEVGKKEVKSVAAITKLLKKNGFYVTSNYKNIPTAFEAVYPNPTHTKRAASVKKPRVAFLCRYDTVEKIGHVNGNNLLTEVAVGAALALRGVIERSSPPLGSVVVIGCPDSVKGGVVPLVNKMAFKEVDVVMIAVPGPRTEWCPHYLGRKILQAVFKENDRPTRSETLRPEGCDAAMVAMQKLIMVREHFDDSWSANMTSGGKSVLIANANEERTTNDGYTRICLKTHTNNDMYLMEKRIHPCLEGAAHALGCRMDISYIRKTYYTFTNNKQLCYLLQLNAYCCGIMATPLKPKPIMEPIDEGNVSHVVPAIRPMFYIGHDAEVGTLQFREAARSHEAQYHTLLMIKAMAMTGLDVFNSSDTLARIKGELKNSRAEEDATAFKPFPVSSVGGYKLKIEQPYDAGKTGWSRMA